MNNKEKLTRLSLYEISDILEHSAVFATSGKRRLNYGTGKSYTSVEAHTASFIADRPGCTVTEISHIWGKTTSAVSQIIKILREEGLVTAERDTADTKRWHLFLTEKGHELDRAHRKYDEAHWRASMEELERRFPIEFIDSFFHILKEWNEINAKLNAEKSASKKGADNRIASITEVLNK